MVWFTEIDAPYNGHDNADNENRGNIIPEFVGYGKSVEHECISHNSHNLLFLHSWFIPNTTTTFLKSNWPFVLVFMQYWQILLSFDASIRCIVKSQHKLHLWVRQPQCLIQSKMYCSIPMAQEFNLKNIGSFNIVQSNRLLRRAWVIWLGKFSFACSINCQ